MNFLCSISESCKCLTLWTKTIFVRQRPLQNLGWWLCMCVWESALSWDSSPQPIHGSGPFAIFWACLHVRLPPTRKRKLEPFHPVIAPPPEHTRKKGLTHIHKHSQTHIGISSHWLFLKNEQTLLWVSAETCNRNVHTLSCPAYAESPGWSREAEAKP